MSNQLTNKANEIAAKLAAYGLNKEAKQTITHRGLLSQNSLGREMTNEIHENEDGVQADTEAAENNSSNRIDAIPNAQNLNTSAQTALANTGSTVETQTVDGCATGTPAEQAKSAAYFAKVLKDIQDKKAAADKAEAEATATKEDNTFVTATEVYCKFASLGPRPTKEDLDASTKMLEQLARTNPVFTATRDNIIMRKKAAEVEELANAAGIAPEDAAAAMDAAVAANPSMDEELMDEATGEAVNDLAGAEQELGGLIEGAQSLADGASQVLQEDITADDIADSIEIVTQMADEMGVPPETLIEAAAQEMMQGEEPNDEDMANAQQIMEAAAEKGIPPEQIIQELASDIDAEGMSGEAGGEEAPIEKAASLQKRITSPRVAYVLDQLNNTPKA